MTKSVMGFEMGLGLRSGAAELGGGCGLRRGPSTGGISAVRRQFGRGEGEEAEGSGVKWSGVSATRYLGRRNYKRGADLHNYGGGRRHSPHRTVGIRWRARTGRGARSPSTPPRRAPHPSVDRAVDTGRRRPPKGAAFYFTRRSLVCLTRADKSAKSEMEKKKCRRAATLFPQF